MFLKKKSDDQSELQVGFPDSQTNPHHQPFIPYSLYRPSVNDNVEIRGPISDGSHKNDNQYFPNRKQSPEISNEFGSKEEEEEHKLKGYHKKFYATQSISNEDEGLQNFKKKNEDNILASFPDSLSSIEDEEILLIEDYGDRYRANYSEVSNQKWLKALKQSSFTYLRDIEQTRSQYKFVNPKKLLKWQASKKLRDNLKLQSNIDENSNKSSQNQTKLDENQAEEGQLYRGQEKTEKYGIGIQNCLYEEQFLRLIGKIKSLETDCYQWEEKLRKIQRQWWIQNTKKDKMNQRIQQMLIENDRLLYESLFEKAEFQNKKDHENNIKIKQIERYHELIALDKELEIEELKIKLKNTEQKYERLTKIRNLSLESTENILSESSFDDQQKNENILELSEPIVGLYQQLKESLDRYEVLQGKNLSLERQLHKKLSEFQMVTSSLENISAINKTLQAQNSQLKQELSKSTQKNQELTLSQERTKDQVIIQEQQIRRLKKQLELFKQTNNSLKKQLDNHETTYLNKQSNLLGIIRDKENQINRLMGNQRNHLQIYNSQNRFISQIIRILQPALAHKFKDTNFENPQNRYKILQFLAEVRPKVQETHYYQQIMELFGINCSQLSNERHLTLINQIVMIKNSCNHLLDHINRAQNDNKYLRIQLQGLGNLYDHQKILLQSLNEQIMRGGLKILSRKLDKWSKNH